MLEAVAGPAPNRERVARDQTALGRWRLLAGQEESLRTHADAEAATEISFYLVVPFVASPGATRAVVETVKRCVGRSRGRACSPRAAVRRVGVRLRAWRAGIEWSLNVRCEPRVVAALDAALSAIHPERAVGAPVR